MVTGRVEAWFLAWFVITTQPSVVAGAGFNVAQLWYFWFSLFLFLLLVFIFLRLYLMKRHRLQQTTVIHTTTTSAHYPQYPGLNNTVYPTAVIRPVGTQSTSRAAQASDPANNTLYPTAVVRPVGTQSASWASQPPDSAPPPYELVTSKH